MRWGARCLCVALAAILYCELLADYVTLWRCSWPDHVAVAEAHDRQSNGQMLHALILADTHLLGPLHGHWLDKLYREWHMHRAFQAAMTLLRPDVVFVLGDLFDEGDSVDPAQFKEYVQRFRRHFSAASDVPIVSAVGNHDVGFHYKMHPYFLDRFEEHFNNTGVRLYTFGDVHFVFINSMAMENDGCYLCVAAERELKEVAGVLQCLRSNGMDCRGSEMAKVFREHKTYSRPVLMQHFPTYRVSDKVCREHDAPILERFRENWEVLSKKSTDFLGKLLNPRVAFAGHSHHYCRNINRWGVEEYTVASFSWRNKINPSFLLARFTASEHAVAKCNMLQQPTVYSIYLTAIVACLTLTLWHAYQKLLRTRTKLKNEILKRI